MDCISSAFLAFRAGILEQKDPFPEPSYLLSAAWEEECVRTEEEVMVLEVILLITYIRGIRKWV